VICEDADSRTIPKPRIIRIYSQYNFKTLLLAIQVAKVTVPAQRHNIDDQNAVVQWNQLEVDGLHEGPNHPVCCQSRPIALVKLVLRTCTLHDGHAAEEDKQVGSSKYSLIASDSGKDFGILVFEDDLILQELEPSCSSWTEDSCVTLLVGGESFSWESRTCLHHTMPSVPSVQDHGSGSPSSQPVVVPWYLLSQTALPL
jgi:hypothetical protein